ncbi:hypothetical protein [Pseudovibrio sp. Ad26]|uniref:hypothetical protein n=1 Tax=Pseudovibrio sp. Ad26 TaxID=989410 RepID=UPI0007AE8E1A|nr:hypothetical protein [Pseudovibrio sp. Ad26]KZL05190.1 hypothetical protein PsAD26_04629 [Pseudovibrio sp. Ad26]
MFGRKSHACQLTIDQYIDNSPYAVDIEYVHYLEDARTIFVNSFAFDQMLSANKAACDLLMRQWVLSVGGVISAGQLKGLSGDTVRTKPFKINAYRPPLYGRAAIIQSKMDDGFSEILRDGIIADVKGIGVPNHRRPYPEFRHNNGFLLLDEAIKEMLLYRIIYKVSLTENAPFDTLPYLGLVDLGFDVQMPDRPPIRATSIVRAAHYRPPNNEAIPERSSSAHKMMITIEKYLQNLGLTSSAEGFQIILDEGQPKLKFYEWDQPYDQDIIKKLANEKQLDLPFTSLSPNIQLCDQFEWSDSSSTLVDFGHYKMLGLFEEPFSVTRVKDSTLNWGETFSNNHQTKSSLSRLHELMGNVDDVKSCYSTEQLEWISPSSQLVKKNNMLDILSLSLAYDYQERGMSGDELQRRINSYADRCVAELPPLATTSKKPLELHSFEV